MVDKGIPAPEAYRLERIEAGRVTTIAIFHSVAEAKTVLSRLGAGYRVMHGDKQLGLEEISSNRHEDERS